MTGLDTTTLKALAEPFAEAQVNWKPGKVSNDKALLMAYLDARDVIGRLNQVVAGEWAFDFWPLFDSPECRTLKGALTVCGVTRHDVGEPGDPPFGDTPKATVSDCLKRCAVHFGVGRYLYYLPAQWVEYDEARKRVTGKPQLPDWAKPTSSAATHITTPARAPDEGSGLDSELGHETEDKPKAAPLAPRDADAIVAALRTTASGFVGGAGGAPAPLIKGFESVVARLLADTDLRFDAATLALVKAVGGDLNRGLLGLTLGQIRALGQWLWDGKRKALRPNAQSEAGAVLSAPEFKAVYDSIAKED